MLIEKVFELLKTKHAGMVHDQKSIAKFAKIMDLFQSLLSGKICKIVTDNAKYLESKNITERKSTLAEQAGRIQILRSLT